MLDQQISALKQKFREQLELTKNQTTLGGFDNVAYGFVEIIENDSIFVKFIEDQIRQELNLRNSIDEKYEAKKIDEEAKETAYNLHVNGAFWHEYYSGFKYIHDSIKIERCEALGVEPTNIYWFQMSSECKEHQEKWEERKKSYAKKLSTFTAKDTISYFEEFYNSLIGLINSNGKLLEQIQEEADSTELEVQPEQVEPLKMTYNSNSGKSLVKYKDKETVFDGRRALILFFFYSNQEGEKTYHDFNAWLKNNKYSGFDADARMFRQEINEINGRLKKESKYLSSLIELVNNSQKDQTKANFYRFKIKPLKP